MLWLRPTIGSLCMYTVDILRVVILFCAEMVEFPKKAVLQRCNVKPSGVVLSVNTLGMMFRILPDVVFEVPEKLDPMLTVWLIVALLVAIMDAELTFVVTILDILLLFAVILLSCVRPMAAMFPVLRLMLLRMPTIDVPVTRNVEDDI